MLKPRTDMRFRRLCTKSFGKMLKQVEKLSWTVLRTLFKQANTLHKVILATEQIDTDFWRQDKKPTRVLRVSFYYGQESPCQFVFVFVVNLPLVNLKFQALTYCSWNSSGTGSSFLNFRLLFLIGSLSVCFYIFGISMFSNKFKPFIKGCCLPISQCFQDDV